MILVIEDNEDDIYFMRRALRSVGRDADVRFITDGSEALAYVTGAGTYVDRAAHPLPEVVFLDLKLPLVNGFDVLSAIRGRPETKHLRVFILTSSSEERDRKQANALGIEGYLVKPPNPAMLRPIFAYPATA